EAEAEAQHQVATQGMQVVTEHAEVGGAEAHAPALDTVPGVELGEDADVRVPEAVEASGAERVGRVVDAQRRARLDARPANFTGWRRAGRVGIFLLGVRDARQRKKRTDDESQAQPAAPPERERA